MRCSLQSKLAWIEAQGNEKLIFAAFSNVFAVQARDRKNRAHGRIISIDALFFLTRCKIPVKADVAHLMIGSKGFFMYPVVASVY